MRLSQGMADESRGSWMITAMRSLVLLMFWFSLLSLGLRGHWIGIIWLGLLAGFGFVFYWKRRKLERGAIFLSSLSAENLGQQQSLAGHFVEENVGWVRRKAQALRRDLAVGIPWERALENRGIARGAYEKLALRLQKTYGRQPESEGDLVHLLSPMRIEAEAERMLGRLMLFSWTVIVGPILLFIGAFIMPTFKVMFEEFGLMLPAPTRFLFSVADFSWQYGIAQLFGVLPMLFIVLVLFCLLLWLFPVVLQQPGFRWLCPDYYQNLGFSALAKAIQHEKDLVAACQQTAALVPVTHISRKYHLAADYLRRGEHYLSAFRHAGLLHPREMRIFESSGFGDSPGRKVAGNNSQDLAWTLQQLASWRIERMLNRYSIVVQLLVVLITIGLAIVVGLIAIGVMLALISMIASLA